MPRIYTPLSNEHKEKLRIAMLKCKTKAYLNRSEKISKGNKGKVRTNEMKEHMRLIKTGKKVPKISLASKGRKLPEEWKKNISLGNIGKKMSQEAKQKISKFQKGRIKSVEERIKISKSNTGKIIHNKEWKQKHSIRMSGIKNPMYGKAPTWYKFLYKNNKFKSSWEVKFAKFLDENNIKWQYEAKTFKFDNMSYTPDFYLLEYDKYVEIKGWCPENIKLKIQRFQELFVVNFLIINNLNFVISDIV